MQAVLVVVIARKNFEHNEKYSMTHQFDAGARMGEFSFRSLMKGASSTCNARI